MIERPSRRLVTRPAFDRTLSWADSVLAMTPKPRAISPAATPPGPARTKRRNTCSRESCARAERRLIATTDSIFLLLWKCCVSQVARSHLDNLQCLWRHRIAQDRASWASVNEGRPYLR